MLKRTSRFAREDRSAVSINQRTEIATEVLRDIPQEHRIALCDFYVGEHDEVIVCTRNNLTLKEFREIKSRARLRFSELREASVDRKPPRVELGGQYRIERSA